MPLWSLHSSAHRVLAIIPKHGSFLNLVESIFCPATYVFVWDSGNS